MGKGARYTRDCTGMWGTYGNVGEGDQVCRGGGGKGPRKLGRDPVFVRLKGEGGTRCGVRREIKGTRDV